jgi:nucleoid-associated protein YgaU
VQDPPVLQPGQPVYIPPVRILEKYYGAPVLNPPPRSPSAPSPARATERSDGAGAQPANLSLVGFGTPIKSLPPPDRPPLYRVHEGGEMMREVARRALGTADRWTEIYDLNRQFDPKDAIPAGSTLLLPKDAHISPQDAP